MGLILFHQTTGTSNLSSYSCPRRYDVTPCSYPLFFFFPSPFTEYLSNKLGHFECDLLPQQQLDPGFERFVSFYWLRCNQTLEPEYVAPLSLLSFLFSLLFSLLFHLIFLYYHSYSPHLAELWNDPIRRRKYFENYARANDFDPLVPDNWYSQSKDKIVGMKVIQKKRKRKKREKRGARIEKQNKKKKERSEITII